MADAIRYCDACGKLIHPADIAEGKAAIDADDSLCPACLANLPAEQRAKLLAQPPLPAKQPGTAARRKVASRRERSAERAAPPTGPVVALAFGVVSLVAAVTVLVLTRSGDNVDPEREGAPPPPIAPPTVPRVSPEPSAPPVAVSPSAAPAPTADATTHAAARPDVPASAAGSEDDVVAELQELVDPSLLRYDDFMSAAKKHLATHAGTPVEKQIRALVDEVARKKRASVEKALVDAEEAARHAMAQADYTAARNSFRYVRMLHASDEWFSTVGEERIAALIKQIDEAEAAYKASGLDLEDDFSRYDDGAASLPGWSAHGAASVSVSGGALAMSGATRLVRNVRGAPVIQASCAITLKGRVSEGGRAWAGLTARLDDDTVIDVALAEGKDGGHSVFIFLMVDGHWETRFSPCQWDYGSSYIIAMTIDDGSVKATASRPDGVHIAEVSLKWQRPGTPLQPGLVVSKCGAQFDHFTATLRKATTSAAPSEVEDDRPAVGATGPIDHTEGLVARWSFDERGDSQPGAADGRFPARVSRATWVAEGRIGGAFRFDGSGRLVVERDDSLSPQHITVAFWVRPERTAETGLDVISKTPGGSYIFQTSRKGTKHYFKIEGKTRRLTFPYTPEAWQHIALTFDGSELRGYRDGALMKSTPAHGTLSRDNKPLGIGGNPFRGGGYRGLIDDVRIYDRALSPDEVGALHAAAR